MPLLRWIALLEGSSLLILLLIAVPLKYGMGMPEAVRLIGPIHGGLFVLFNGLLMAAWFNRQINTNAWLLGVVAALIPTGTFIYKATVLKNAHVGVDKIES